MKHFLLLFSFLCLVSLSTLAKDDPYNFDKKTGIVTDLNGAVLFKIDYVKSVTAALMDDYYFRNSDGKLLIVFKYITYKHPSLVTSSNTSGSESYYEIKFFSEPVMESECNYVFLKSLVKRVFDSQLIVNGQLNMEKVNEFVVINGNNYSRRRAELMGRY